MICSFIFYEQQGNKRNIKDMSQLLRFCPTNPFLQLYPYCDVGRQLRLMIARLLALTRCSEMSAVIVTPCRSHHYDSSESISESIIIPY